MPRKPFQTVMSYGQHGGVRPGAGRPKAKSRKVPHRVRPSVPKGAAVHVTYRVLGGVASLRKGETFVNIQRAFDAAKELHGFRLTHWSVQGNHLHLLGEAADTDALSAAMQGLSVRLSRGINRAQGRRGRVFADHYAVRIVRTPTEAAYAIRYVLQNLHRHAAQQGRALPPAYVDPCASVAEGMPAARPRTWLLTAGWQRVKVAGARCDPGFEPAEQQVSRRRRE